MQYWYSPTNIESALADKLEKAGIKSISRDRLDENIQNVLLIYSAPNQVLEQKRLEESTSTTCAEVCTIYEAKYKLSRRCKHISSSWRLNALDVTSISRLCNGESPQLDENISLPSVKPLASLLTLEIARRRPEVVETYLDLELKSYLFGLQADSNYLQRLSQGSLIDLTLMDWWEVNLEREASFEEVKNNLNQILQIQNDCERHIMENQRLQKSVKRQRAKIELLLKENKELKRLSAHQEKSNHSAAEDYVVTSKIIVERIKELKPDENAPSGLREVKLLNNNRLLPARIAQRVLRLLGRKSQ